MNVSFEGECVHLCMSSRCECVCGVCVCVLLNPRFVYFLCIVCMCACVLFQRMRVYFLLNGVYVYIVFQRRESVCAFFLRVYICVHVPYVSVCLCCSWEYVVCVCSERRACVSCSWRRLCMCFSYVYVHVLFLCVCACVCVCMFNRMCRFDGTCVFMGMLSQEWFCVYVCACACVYVLRLLMSIFDIFCECTWGRISDAVLMMRWRRPLHERCVSACGKRYARESYQIDISVCVFVS